MRLAERGGNGGQGAPKDTATWALCGGVGERGPFQSADIVLPSSRSYSSALHIFMQTTHSDMASWPCPSLIPRVLRAPGGPWGKREEEAMAGDRDSHPHFSQSIPCFSELRVCLYVRLLWAPQLGKPLT